jgi:D-lactate dehydrogenase
MARVVVRAKPVQTLQKQLKEVCMLDGLVSFELSDRAVHAHDASLYRMMPRGVARPRNDDDVLKLIAWARENRVGLTFRTGGTSLSGQAVTDGLLVSLGRDWDSVKIENDGSLLTCGPALRGGIANAHLATFERRIGPDPASLQAACMGGIVANNASGMCCGTEENSYQTLVGLRLILASGTTIDTRDSRCDALLREKEPQIYSGLLALREKIHSSPRLVELIRRKTAGKNTMGYGLQAFLDYSRPADILAHLIVGSEGTLAFISEITLRTVPLRPHRASALFSFRNLDEACELAPELREAGCNAIELFDHASVQALLGHPELPHFLRELPQQGACLLLQLQCNTADELSEKLTLQKKFLDHKYVQHRTDYFSEQRQQNKLWDLRKGIFPAVGARRPKGTSVIIEDVAFALPKLAQGTRDLRVLLDSHGYSDAVIYGHARDGNLHFVLAQDFSRGSEILRYERFITDMVECVAVKHDGALKAEHGTGRNMAPFVEKEWGTEAYQVMRELKRLLDPEGIFNPGVLLSSDPKSHLAHLKTMPLVDDEIDACIECGFCEPVCPSQGLTLSPRGRIVMARENVREIHANNFSFSEDSNYQLLQTCAADGLCAHACPVGINTGEWVKKVRSQTTTTAQRRGAEWLAKESSLVEKIASAPLAIAKMSRAVLGQSAVESLSALLNRGIGTPVWSAALDGVKPDSLLQETDGQADVVIFRSCVTRSCGTTQTVGTATTGADSLLLCSQRAGVRIKQVSEAGQCCGQPWSSKGYKEPSLMKLSALIDLLFTASEGGKIPIVIDNSPCFAALFEDSKELADNSLASFQSLTLWDPVDYALFLAQKMAIKPLAETLQFFPVCSVRKTGKGSAFEALARKICAQPVFPKQEACCGMAGDRGLWFPELTRNAVERFHWGPTQAQAGVCSSRTCEVALSQSGIPYRSLFDALEQATRPG